MPQATNIAAIDAGSNALRMIIVHASSADEIYTLKKDRIALRLGHHVFTRNELDKATIKRAVDAFRRFSEAFKRHEVKLYRAVGTSALREAANRAELVERIYGETGLLLEVISGAEEARLVRQAVLMRLGKALHPRLILDLGGGSLEFNLMNGDTVRKAVTLPLGAVRLMETFDVSGVIRQKEADKIRRRVLYVLRREIGDAPNLSSAISAACGGNAETLAQLAPALSASGIEAMDMRALDLQLDSILGIGLERRMRRFKIRRDRAEVIAIAALVFSTLARWARIRYMLVPGVGVREGILEDLLASHFYKRKK
ncbi:hypothetical protein HY256_00690 [Candidatus Sumerlaeota bacterium]|nr:hypothetical protein [Candidatus Sumerlaeota bacterium]